MAQHLTGGSCVCADRKQHEMSRQWYSRPRMAHTPPGCHSGRQDTDMVGSCVCADGGAVIRPAAD
jgi:hypothetical protein